MGKSKRLFRSSVRGFNKNDVNSYIVSTNNEFSARETALNAEIASLKHKLSVSAERLNEAVVASQNIQELEKALNETKNRLENTESELASAKESVERLENELKTSGEEREALKVRVRELEESIESREAECAEKTTSYEPCANADEKSKMYDELSRNIGEIMLNANRNAERIVRDAELRANTLTSGGLERTDNAKKQLTLVTGRAVAAMKKSAIRNADSYIREFKQYTENVAKSSRALSSELERKYAELSARADALGNELEEAMKAVIRDYDRKCNAIKTSIASESDKR